MISSLQRTLVCNLSRPDIWEQYDKNWKIFLCHDFDRLNLALNLVVIRTWVVILKQCFSAKTSLKLAIKKQEQRLCAFLLSLYCWIWVNIPICGLGNKNVLIVHLPLFLCLWCWLWASMYCWNTDYIVSKLLCFMPQLIFNFTTLMHVQ